MNKRLLLGSLFALIGLCSCNITLPSIVSYDRLEPATASFPSAVANVGVMPWNENISSFLYIISQNVAQQIADADFFDNVIVPTDSDLNDWKGKFGYPLTFDDVDTICNQLGTDLLVCVCHAEMNENNPSDDYSNEVEGAEAKVMAIVFQRGKRRGLSICDSLRFSFSNVIYVPEDLATIISSSVVPTWKTQERKIYSNSSVHFRDAMSFYEKGNYAKAIDIWESVYNAESKSSGKAYMAAHNLAVCYERIDQPDSAIVWVDKCELSYSGKEKNTFFSVWREKLNARALAIKKLEIQMTRKQ